MSLDEVRAPLEATEFEAALRKIPMRFWWVNQNQTYRHEFAGGYL